MAITCTKVHWAAIAEGASASVMAGTLRGAGAGCLDRLNVGWVIGISGGGNSFGVGKERTAIGRHEIKSMSIADRIAIAADYRFPTIPT